MAIAKMYGKCLMNALGGEVLAETYKIDYLSDAIKVALLSSSYAPNQDTHELWADVSTQEVTGTGYTAGGATLAGKTMTYDSANNKIVIDADDVTWASSTITARYAVIYDSASNVLMGYIDFESDQSSSNGNFTIQWATGGIFNITVA